MHLLLAGVQAVRVVNNPALHVKIVSAPLPVHITNGPDSWAKASTVAAVSAAVIALVTLVAVLRQIGLAKDALKAAKDALDLAADELRVTKDSNALVSQDLEYSRAQVQYINRRAKLSLWHNRQRIPEQWILVREPADETDIEVNLWLVNDGDNTARDATLFLWLPSGWKVPGWNGIVNPGPFFQRQGLTAIANVPLNGERYWHVVAPVALPTYPSMERLAHTFTAIVPIGFRGDVLWRIGYDDGITPPQSEPEGRLPFRIFRPGEGEDVPESQI